VQTLAVEFKRILEKGGARLFGWRNLENPWASLQTRWTCL